MGQDAATPLREFHDVASNLDVVQLLPHPPVQEQVPHGPVGSRRPIKVHRELVRDGDPSVPRPLFPPVDEILRHPTDDTLENALVIVGVIVGIVALLLVATCPTHPGLHSVAGFFHSHSSIIHTHAGLFGPFQEEHITHSHCHS